MILYMLSIIAARAANNVIGNNNELPWELPEDLKWFKAKTEKHPVIMGLNTFFSILARLKRPLPNRPNFILSGKKPSEIIELIENNPLYGIPNFEQSVFSQTTHFHNSLESAILDAEILNTEVFVIGGARVYQEALPYASRMYLTEIQQEFNGDVFFPTFNQSEWRLIPNLEDNRVRTVNNIDYYFATYFRNWLKQKAA